MTDSSAQERPGPCRRGARAALIRKLVVLVALGLVFAGFLACSRSPDTLVLATTTSTDDSGLLDAILPAFEQANNVRVEVVAVGTGQALALAERGDADVILVHDPEREATFVASGYGVNRRDVMYNDFVILGPSADPAGVAGLQEARVAFTRIAQEGERGKVVFLSRGDRSGTYGKELEVWSRAGIEPQGAWYRESGQGMSETLTMASEMEVYTLSDRGTYLSRGRDLELKVVLEGDSALFNPYGVMAVNPEKHPNVNYALAMKFIEHITSYDTQQRIAQFGKEQFGQQLFYPNSEEWKARQR